MNPYGLNSYDYKFLMGLGIWLLMAGVFIGANWALFEGLMKTKRGAYMLNRLFDYLYGPDL